MYYPHIDFHTAGVEDFLQEESRYAHVLLDLAAPESVFPQASRALRFNGCLMIFCPSITQIVECYRLVKTLGLPLVLDKTVEMGTGISGGRLWDMRFAQVRQAARKRQMEERRRREASEAEELSTSGDLSVSELEDRFVEDVASTSDASGLPAGAIGATADQDSVDNPSSSTDANEELKIVCRPKVGEQIVGGGFLGVFKKTS